MRTITIVSNDQPIGAIMALTLMSSGDEDGNHVLNISRIRFDSALAAEIFTDGKAQVMTQVYPFHIVLADDGVEVGRATNVWLTSIGYSYTAGNFIIIDGMEALAEKVKGIASNSSNNLPADQIFEPLEPIK